MSDERPLVPEKTRLDQRRAADPSASAWVSANAGAGKTKVLTDRVVRLLLAGAPPGRILCLTFTKAAAATMAIRVFERLGRWVTLDDDALGAELAELEGRRPSPEHLRRARRLFARAVETPGGLKIETIHAFCERILHLVPFEAGVPARFTVLDESEVEELIAQATADVLGEAATDESPRLAAAFGALSLDAVGDALSQVIAAAVREVACGRARGKLSESVPELRRTLGLAPHETPAEIERAMLEDGLAPAEWTALATALQPSKAKTDQGTAATLLRAVATSDEAERLLLVRALFFTEKGERRVTLCTQAAGPSIAEALLAEQHRLAGLDDRLKAARAVERTEALFTLAQAIVARVAAHKARIGALDFQDLIAKTLALLSRGDVAWVLYKLDRGIDHVLVDEAQDTNPEQWQILRLITEDFTAGAGARSERLRTLFAVGDPKQSIYGFQGAEPREFEASRRTWKAKLEAAALRFEDVRLTLSFRSCKAVLTAVDETFRVPEHFRGLSFDDAAVGTTHQSARPGAPGLVELWPTEAPAEETEPDAWSLPVDELEPNSPPVVVAQRIARVVKSWIATGDESGRIRSAGEILILVRKRGPAFLAVIRALRGAGVPVAGADRIEVGEHIAVLDLVAAGRAALLPDDDLTLATALKSPLVGLDDEDLEHIAADRGEAEPLRAALARHAELGHEAARRACEALTAWRALAQKHGPFGFYASLLGPCDGRAKLVARLGNEAGDAIDAFLCFAHGAEARETPSLATFLCRFESASHQVKRDLDPARDEVRVMTVHGAKGLEAPCVIVIDGCDVLGPDPRLIPVPLLGGGSLPVWSPGKTHDCGLLAEAREALHERGREEHNRLLYVAMTRAKDRLVIAPFRTSRQDAPEQAWCEMVRRALSATAGALVRTESPFGAADVWRDGSAWPEPAARSAGPSLAALEAPAWLTTALETEPEALSRLRPSQALVHRSAGRAIADHAAEARLRGVLIHALLQRLPTLPAERREAAARAYVRARAPRLDARKGEALVADALAVLRHEALAELFGPSSRAEVAIAGRVGRAGEERPVSGRIDRLAVLADEVLVADFKSTAGVPRPAEALPAPHAAQLALYRELLREIYPTRRVRAFLIWTAGPSIQELPEGELKRALDLVTAT